MPFRHGADYSVKGLSVVVLEKLHRPFYLATGARLDDRPVFRELILLRELMGREQSITFGCIQKLLADSDDPTRTTAIDESQVKSAVALLPFHVGLAAAAPAGFRQPVQREDQVLLPIRCTPLDGFPDGDAVNPDAGLDQFRQLSCADGRNPKAFLLLQTDEPFRQERFRASRIGLLVV